MSDGDDFAECEDVWQFPESLLIHYLLRAAAGESVDMGWKRTPITSTAARKRTDG